MQPLPRSRIYEMLISCAFLTAVLCTSCHRGEVGAPGPGADERYLVDRRVNSFLENGRFEEALKMTDSLVAAGWSDARLLGQRARALGELGKSKEAIAAYEEALLKDYENCENHLRFATYLMRLGKTGRAHAEFMDAKRFCEEGYLPLIYRNLAVAAIKLDKKDLARQYVEEGLLTKPDDSYLSGLKGMLIARERPAAAESLFVKARSAGDAPPEFLVQYGLLLINEGRPAEAIPVLQAASNSRPGNSEIRLYIAEAYDRAGKYREAQNVLETLPAAKDDKEAAKKLAKVLFHERDYGRALALYMTFEQTPEIMDRIAMCLHNLGRSDEALPWERKALVSKPDWPQAMINLSVILASKGELDEAASLLERALSIEPDNVAARTNLERLREAQRKRPDQKR